MGTKHLSIKEIETAIDGKAPDDILELLEGMKNDHRTGVHKLLEKYWRLEAKKQQQIEKAQSMIKIEGKLWQAGYQLVGGVDEAGRGPLAGPVVAACVIFPEGLIIEGIDDSKKLTPLKRQILYEMIMDKATCVGIGRVSPERIDSVNILNATLEAMEQAVRNCNILPDYLLIDAERLYKCPIPQQSLVKGDSISQSIAAASIIAKVTRDNEMVKWHEKYPEYGFDKHKAYGTADHIQVIKKIGLSPIHRKSFCYKFI